MKLPHGWRTVRLAEIIDPSRPISYGVVQTGDNITDGVPCVRVVDLTEGSLDSARMIRTSSKISASYGRTVLQSGDLMMALRGEIGRAALVPTHLVGVNLTRGIALLSKNPAKFHSPYLLQALSSPKTKLALRHGVNGTGLMEIPIGNLREVVVDLPSMPEQQKIADILGTWDEALEKLDTLIAVKARRKQALMQQLLTGHRRLPGFRAPWAQSRFGDLMKSEDRYADFNDDHLYKLVSARRRAEGVFFREALHGREIKTKVMKQVRAGDFVISRMQVVHGGLGVVPPECDGYYASDSYEVLVPRDPEKLSPRFIGHLCRTRRFWHHALVCSHGVHIEKMTFVMVDFEHEKFMIPEFAEQIAIADILDTADAELRLLRQQRTALDRQKRGLMQQLLTGKVRVST